MGRRLVVAAVILSAAGAFAANAADDNAREKERKDASAPLTETASPAPVTPGSAVGVGQTSGGGQNTLAGGPMSASKDRTGTSADTPRTNIQPGE